MLQCCFLDDSFVTAHHARQGHQLQSLGAVASGERVTTFVTGGVGGYGELLVTDRVLHTLSGDGRALVVESRATLEGVGPAARLKPVTRWEVDGSHVKMRLEAVFVSLACACPYGLVFTLTCMCGPSRSRLGSPIAC